MVFGLILLVRLVVFAFGSAIGVADSTTFAFGAGGAAGACGFAPHVLCL